MRFLHTDFAPLHDYLIAESCRIRRLEWDLHPIEPGSFAFLPWTVKRRPANLPQPATAAEVESYFRRSDRPEAAGTILQYFFHVDAPQSDVAISLNGAVEHIEAFGGPTEFLLAGYPDGGVISVSRRMLSFQQGVPQADGWGP